MRKISYIILLILFPVAGCITQFIPEIDERQSLIVVEGILTDQPGNKIRLSRSVALGERERAEPVRASRIWITNDQNLTYDLYESQPGTYNVNFTGSIGRKYMLHFIADGLTFESYPLEMFPVPVIDSIYYEKKLIEQQGLFKSDYEGCQVYLDADDPTGKCIFYRWDFTETWEFHIPFSRAINNQCWISRNSIDINIKSTAGLSRSVVEKLPVNFITNETDRLTVKYSMLINQYSLTRDEYIYWDKLKSITQNVGSLYDIIPAAIPNNIYCVENPAIKVLGYFSVSSKSSKRIFIDDFFRGQLNMYNDCIHDTIFGGNPVIPNLGISTWILDQNIGIGANPPYTTITYTQGCADCTVRGTKQRPDFWR